LILNSNFKSFFLAPDGRVIVFGGVSDDVPATPHLSVLNTAKTPYEWSTPIIENSIGCFSGHTATIINNNYMISAFGKYNLIIYFLCLNSKFIINND
jgi:hypothetical protein